MSRGKPILLYHPGAEQLARNIFGLLGEPWRLMPMQSPYFDDGEVRPYLEKGPTNSVRGADTYLLQVRDLNSPRSPQDDFMALTLGLSTLTECGARYRTAITPWYIYACQERRRKREPISAKAAAVFMTAMGATNVISVDIHDNAIQGFFDATRCNFDGIFASSILIDWLQQNFQILDQKNCFVFSSVDLGGNKRVRYAGRATGIRTLAGDKQKDYQQNAATDIQFNGRIKKDEIVIVLDDMVRSASTIKTAAASLKQKGAKKIIIAATHADFCSDAVAILDQLHREKFLEKAVFTDSFTLPPDFLRQHPWMAQISLSQLLAEAMLSLSNEESVSHVYEEDEENPLDE